MKTVFSSHDEVAHIWASQSQYEGRASRVFFEGGTIYSYGRHFPVARFAPEYGNIVLFTDQGYSSSTGKHKSLIRAAIPSSYQTIYCSDPTRSNQHNLDIWADKVGRLRIHFASKTHKITRGNLAVEIFKLCESASIFCDAVKMAAPEWVNETDAEMSARDYVYELAKARDAKKEAAREAYAKAAAIKAADRLTAWSAGENVPLEGFQYHATALRLKNDQIQTSRGANIPAVDAVKLWPLLVRAKNGGKTLNAGLHTINLGAYRFHSFDGDTLVVGCHSIAWPELEKIAIQLNLVNEAVTV
jgi:hypothetical protein